MSPTAAKPAIAPKPAAAKPATIPKPAATKLATAPKPKTPLKSGGSYKSSLSQDAIAPKKPVKPATAPKPAARMRGRSIKGSGVMVVGATVIETAQILTSNASTAEKVDQVVESVGGLTGAAAGAAVGAAVGSVVPIIGTAIGGFLGSVLGYWGGAEVGDKAGDWFFDYFDANAEDAKNQLNKLTANQDATAQQAAENVVAAQNKKPGNINLNIKTQSGTTATVDGIQNPTGHQIETYNTQDAVARS